MDDGYCIVWDGNTEGREIIDLSHVGTPDLHKVSNVVLTREKVTGAFFVFATIDEEFSGEQSELVTENSIISDTGWVAVAYGSQPVVVSGIAGTYNFNGVDIAIPSTGTYFARGEGDFVAYINKLYKAATD